MHTFLAILCGVLKLRAHIREVSGTANPLTYFNAFAGPIRASAGEDLKKTDGLNSGDDFSWEGDGDGRKLYRKL